MMKKLNNDILQFDDINEFFNYSIKTYVELFENEIDVNIIEMFCNMYNEIKNVHKNILHIILYDDCFCVYENKNKKNDKNVAHLYSCDENDFYYIKCAYCDNYDEFLKINDLYYIYDDVLQMYVNETKIFDCVCDNALIKINDIEFNIIYDCDKYEMLIEKNNCFYVVDVNFCDCEFINNYATKIKLTRIS